ncbi:MAG: Crp/Fnr family transcriptional regulator [Cyanobacteria bacterium P01_C01_bin.72]
MKLDLVDRLSDSLRNQGIAQTVVKGQRLFRKGDRAGYLYIIKAGRFQEVGYPETDKVAVLQILNTGDILGETGLAAQIYRSTAIALTDSEVIAYPLNIILEALENSPTVIKAMVEVLSQKIYELQVRLEWRNISLADHRVLEYLKYKLEQLTLNTEEPTSTLTLNIPLQEIAAELGFVPGTLSRALAKLEADQAIIRQQNRITLLNNDAA